MMNTTAAVAMMHEDETLTSIVVLKNADPDRLGEILITNYPSPQKIEELLKGGNINKIAKRVEKCTYLAQVESLPMSQWQAKQWRNLSHFMSICMQEYDYLYIYRSGKWYCHDCNE